jgi:outer membrane murein-binding lipoprotein Lpp
MPQRSSAEIRASIEETRRELSYSVTDLQSKVKELTNWRARLAENQQAAIIVAAAAGFVIGGGIAAIGGLFRR